MAILLNLRQSFTYFMPSEIARISETVVTMYNTDLQAIEGSSFFSHQEVAQAISADQRIAQALSQ